MTISFITSLINLLANFTEVRWSNLKDFGEYLFGWFGSRDGYKVLSNEIELEIIDNKGEIAHYRKRKNVQFLQNNVHSYLDTVWGDGDVFVDYKCSQGKAVDFYEEGYRNRVLISLRETRQRGDKQEFYIQRTIKNGYTDEEGYLQTDITYRTKYLQMRVIFPDSRYPKIVQIIEKNRKKTVKLDREHFMVLPDGRYQIEWEKKNPRLHEGYIMSWKW